MLAYLLQGLGYGFAAAVQPGPFQTYVMSQALERGWRRALPAALAPLISDGPIIALTLLVLTRLPPSWERVLLVVGGIFILYLAWGAFQAWRRFDLTGPEPEPAVAAHGLVKAALMNALSPGPYLYWSLVTGPILLAGWREAPAHGVGFLAGFYFAMVGAVAALIVLFGTARHLGPRVTRALVGLSALALTGFGLVQLARGIF